MRVITANVNGIRATAKKGFFDWFKKSDPDFMCLQETKAQLNQLTDPIFFPKGYHAYFFDAKKKGYSGVAIYSKQKPEKISYGLGFETADTEGRYIQADFKKYSIISIYLPSGSSGEIRQEVKYDFLDRYLKVLKQQIKTNHNYIICGDFNIVHKEIDIKNWKSNQKSSGCLPKERAWLDQIFDKLGFIDAYRYFNPDKIQYTWWSNRGQAYANNVGWRLDYQVITPAIKNLIINTDVYTKEKFSDHAPVVIDYDL